MIKESGATALAPKRIFQIFVMPVGCPVTLLFFAYPISRIGTGSSLRLVPPAKSDDCVSRECGTARLVDRHASSSFEWLRDLSAWPKGFTVRPAAGSRGTRFVPAHWPIKGRAGRKVSRSVK
ncbi:MAG: hypothetical protein VST70_05770 [Nitrospirota bacterium]|nr:hypothetical protein [Nitrospirota bacterium]